MKKQKTIRAWGCIKAVFLMTVFLMAGSFLGEAQASAAKETDASSFPVMHKEIYVGDGFSIYDFVQDRGYSYGILPESQNPNAVEISKDGVVSAKEEGMVDLFLTNQGKEEVFTVTVMEPEKIYAGYGSVVELPAWKWYDSSAYECVFEGNSLEAGKTAGSYVVTGFQKTELFLHKKGTSEKIKVADILIDLPEFSSEHLTRAIGTAAFSPSIEHCVPDANLAFWVEDEEKASVVEGKVTGLETGSTILHAEVQAKNGEKYSFFTNLIITDPNAESEGDTIVTGETKKISFAGIDEEYSVCTYDVSNMDILSVSEHGEVEGVSAGLAEVRVTVDGKEFSFSYLVVDGVPKDAGKKAAKDAVSIAKSKTQYSQTKRMEEGYYDCSSLVSRIYRSYHIFFGVESGPAPTAAGIGKWCTDNKKVIAKKGISYKKLKKGDLIFYSHRKNGRYLNITHVEIYVGSGKCVSASANKNKVIQYDYSANSVVLIARPVKNSNS